MLNLPAIMSRRELLVTESVLMSNDVIFKEIFTAICYKCHFWLSVKSSFTRSMVQFYIEDCLFL